MYIYLILPVFFLLPLAEQIGAQPVQPIRFQHTARAQGLSQSTVYDIARDAKGFMWFATQDGLNRFDGYNMQVYKHNPEDPNSLSFNDLRVLHVDRSGFLWIGTDGGGLQRFDPRLNLFKTWRKITDIHGDGITDIIETGLNKIIIALSPGGIEIFDQAKENFTHIPLRDSLGTPIAVNALLERPDGLIMIATTGQGLILLNPLRMEWFHSGLHLPDEKITALESDGNGSVWLGTDRNGVFHYNWVENRITGHLRVRDNQKQDVAVFDLMQDTAGRLWIATDGGGLQLYHTGTGEVRYFAFNDFDETSLSHNIVMKVFADPNHLIWVGTDGGSVNLFDPYRPFFGHLTQKTGYPNSLSNKMVWSVIVDDQKKWWIGTDKGLNVVEPSDGVVRKYFFDPTDPFSLSSDEVMSILQDRQGRIWIGTWRGGLNLFDPLNKRFFHYTNDPNNPNTLSDNHIRMVYQTRDNMIWLATRAGGLNRFDPESGRFTRFVSDPQEPGTITDNSILTMFEDRDGDFWIGTWGGGLCRMNRESGLFTSFTSNGKEGSISSNSVSIVFQDSQGELWVGTHAGGLNHFDKKTGKFSSIRTKDGLPNEVIYGILEDARGNLWISSNNGLFTFHPGDYLRGQLKIKTYYKSDGLQDDEFNNQSYFKDRNGMLFFGGINGLTYFNPETLPSNPNPPEVVLHSLQIMNIDVPVLDGAGSKSTLEYLNEIDIQYEQKVFSFEFTALNYSMTGRTQYAYKLEGVDEDWVYSDKERRYVSYTNLDPGEYLFKVKAANTDGLWDNYPTTLTIHIIPPFWMSRWFQFLVAFIFIAGTVILTRHRFLSLKQQQAVLRKEVEKKTRILRSQRDDLELALKKVQQLKGLLPICASCKKIRDDKGYWNEIELYIREHSEADFSHSLCPECFNELYPDMRSAKKDSKPR